MSNETLLLSRERIAEFHQKLKNHPEASSICPVCGNVFTEEYEVCNCVRYR